MKEKEIQLYFPHTKDDNIDDIYDEKLFEFKQFFLNKPTIPKVFKAKIEKIKKFETAFRELKKQTNKLTENKHSNYSQLKTEGVNILETFNNYQKTKNQFKLLILNANNSTALIEVIENLMEITFDYLHKWPYIKNEEKIILSKEPNPMDILSSIKEFNLKGGFEFADIIKLQNKCPKLLQLESKRLSLQLNILNNG
jgi:hypothetical protein